MSEQAEKRTTGELYGDLAAGRIGINEVKVQYRTTLETRDVVTGRHERLVLNNGELVEHVVLHEGG